MPEVVRNEVTETLPAIFTVTDPDSDASNENDDEADSVNVWSAELVHVRKLSGVAVGRHSAPWPLALH